MLFGAAAALLVTAALVVWSDVAYYRRHRRDWWGFRRDLDRQLTRPTRLSIVTKVRKDSDGH